MMKIDIDKLTEVELIDLIQPLSLATQFRSQYRLSGNARAERRLPARKGPHHEWDNQEDWCTNPASMAGFAFYGSCGP